MNNDIFPCLWCNGDAKESAEFYCQVFGGKITVDTPVVINIELFGQKLMLLNAGPQFEKNPSISFLINCASEEDVQHYWDQLSEGGMVLMELDSYPWSKKYGWIKDKYGTTWQLYFGEMQEQRLVPTLMFMHRNNGKAMEAMEFYTSTFPESKIEGVLKYKDGGENGEDPENVQHAQFVINNYMLSCMDSSLDHKFDFNEGISLVMMTNDQKETDHLWNTLISGGGRESMCGWLKDQYGVSWQIVPKKLIELMNDIDPAKSQKVVQAMLKMQKIIIAHLEEAYNS
ncbi:TPA: VOC family protein [Elizabethkingia anophelis]|uniref:VOC family protein n=1 Tax=Elizabethkingia anophelis TaxID=1117645 RepID=UPI00040D041F|nr:VOC family protein [Elizabethkingia anophelis]MCT3743369.1 VOC family protein [Elizabethkingia anophelis]MDC8025190.1 VOC family protein [Elizabethkingia anophelis]MDV3490526.1 VOC family protein [Elizabethkingia anophelis]HAT3993002.1 VOC family protein [Elizabethkingia anophelis]HAT3994656.1 VOC family protein [Elizabethkingia anophelis]